MIRDTMFAPSFGNRPAYLVGRDALVERFVEGLSAEPGSRDRAVVMLGQRGYGKTVLLWELADRAAAMGYVVAHPTIASSGMLDRIVEKVQQDGRRHMGSKSVRLANASIGAFGFSAGLEFTREVQEGKSSQFKLTQLARKLTAEGHGMLILIDELQANSEEIRQLVSLYQELVGERLNVALVMAGLPGAVSATLNDKVLTFLNRARKVSLPPLSLGDVDAYYARAFEELGVCILDGERKHIVKESMGSPYLMQLLGHNVVVRATDQGQLNGPMIDAAVEAARADFENDVCGTLLAALSVRDAQFLSAMARDEGDSSISAIAERMNVTQDYAQKYRKRLIDAGAIEPAGWGLIRFAVPYLADYLRRETGVW